MAGGSGYPVTSETEVTNITDAKATTVDVSNITDAQGGTVDVSNPAGDITSGSPVQISMGQGSSTTVPSGTRWAVTITTTNTDTYATIEVNGSSIMEPTTDIPYGGVQVILDGGDTVSFSDTSGMIIGLEHNK